MEHTTMTEEIPTVSRDNAVCDTCLGAGGWKGEKQGRNRVWVECPICKGTGTQPEDEAAEYTYLETACALYFSQDIADSQRNDEEPEEEEGE